MSRMNANNVVMLVGRVASDISIRVVSPSNNKKMFFKLAVKKSFQPQNQDVSDAYFIPIAVWGRRVDGLERLINMGLLGKGALIAVVGELRVESYRDAVGNWKQAVEVVASDIRFLGAPGGRAPATAATATTAEGYVGSDIESDGVAIDEAVDNLDSENWGDVDVNPEDYVEFPEEDDDIDPGALPPDGELIP